MRLQEIIDFTPRTTNRNRNDLEKRLAAAGASKINHGKFANVTGSDSSKRLSQVKKVGRTGRNSTDAWSGAGEEMMHNDGYLSYLHMVDIASNAGINNPYFPKIISLKVFKSKKDNTIHYSADLEKLYPYDTPEIVDNTELMDGIKEHMFGNDWLYAGYSFLDMFTMSFQNTAIIEDAELTQAVLLIKDIADQGHFGLDIHTGNIMWRMTGNMPHLVITDPLA